MIPLVLEESGGSERAYDIYSRLLKERIEASLPEPSIKNKYFEMNPISSEEWKKDKKWDPCYPKFNEKNKKIALEKYWNDYHLKTKELQLRAAGLARTKH